jgi:hypothetical protein
VRSPVGGLTRGDDGGGLVAAVPARDGCYVWVESVKSR